MGATTIKPGDTVRLVSGVFIDAPPDFFDTDCFVTTMRGTQKATVSNRSASITIEVCLLKKAEAPPGSFKVGDRVKVVLNKSNHGFRLGSNVTVDAHRRVGREGAYYLCSNTKGDAYKVMEEDIRKLNA